MKIPIKNLFGYISSLAQNEPNRMALLEADKEGKIQYAITYKELRGKLEYAAFWLMQNGLKDKDVLALAMPASNDFLILSWACWSMGIITAPLDIKRDTINEHKFKLDISSAKLIIAKKGIFTKDDKLQFSKYKLIEIDNLDYKNVGKKILWKNDLENQALILFTSGTTAHPKGAQLSLENLVVNADGIKHWFKITNNDRFLVVLPLHHINSTSFCLATLLSGGSIALVPNYSNSRFWQQLAFTSSTFTSIVPSICFDQLERKKEYDLVKNELKINRIQIGSAPVMISDVKKFMKTYGIPIYQGYGQTETSLRVTGVPLDLDKKTYENLVDSNSIGRVMEWADVEIADEKGKALPENEEGELAVKGQAVMKGYLHKEKPFSNGYFLTGDIGYYKIINGDRYFFLKGRKKEIIIKGGINISPVAVENKLKEMFEDIDQVFVIGVIDRRYGEEIAAVICWKNIDIQKAKAYLKYRLAKGVKTISRYETPKYITTINAENLPTTSTGKVQRSLIQNKILMDTLEPVNLVTKTNKHKFILLAEDFLLIKEAFDLYNYSWDPLIINFDKFRELISNTTTIIAIDLENKIKGLITFMRLDIFESQLSSFTYDRLVSLQGKNIVDNNGDSLVCISICGPNYKQESIPNVKKIPTAEGVKEYLSMGEDSVYNFHVKPKGGFTKGASLISLLPNARPQDKRSLGYNMLLKYPKITKDIHLTEDASVATQLIESVMLVARELGIKNVYAFSRPSGLASYFSGVK